MATLARTHLGSPRLAQAHRGGPGRAPRAALWDRRNTTVNAATSQIGVAVRTGRWRCACANVWTCGHFGVDVMTRTGALRSVYSSRGTMRPTARGVSVGRGHCWQRSVCCEGHVHMEEGSDGCPTSSYPVKRCKRIGCGLRWHGSALPIAQACVAQACMAQERNGYIYLLHTYIHTPDRVITRPCQPTQPAAKPIGSYRSNTQAG